MTIIVILALIASWLLFYQLLKARNKKIPAVKATIITLLFAALIVRLSTDLYAHIERAIFSLNKQGQVQLSASPLKIPANQGLDYCKQFTDQNKKIIQAISQRSDGEYCGEFWHFEEDQHLALPFKLINNNQVVYWASPTLNIIGPLNGGDRLPITNKK